MPLEAPRAMAPRPLKPLMLPCEKKKCNDAMRLVCEMIEGVIACNTDTIPLADAEDSAARIFVSSMTTPSATTLTRYVRELFAIVPKTWPAALWMADAACRRGDLAFTPRTARRLLAGCVYLLISTEDDGEMTRHLIAVSQKTVGSLVRLGDGVLDLLARGDEAGTEDGWEATLGLCHIGWVRGAIPRFARNVEKEFYRKRTAAAAGAAIDGNAPPVHLLTRRAEIQPPATPPTSYPATPILTTTRITRCRAVSIASSVASVSDSMATTRARGLSVASSASASVSMGLSRTSDSTSSSCRAESLAPTTPASQLSRFHRLLPQLDGEAVELAGDAASDAQDNDHTGVAVSSSDEDDHDDHEVGSIYSYPESLRPHMSVAARCGALLRSQDEVLVPPALTPRPPVAPAGAASPPRVRAASVASAGTH